MDEREQRPWDEEAQRAWIKSRLAWLHARWEHGQLSWGKMLMFYRWICEEFGEEQ